MSDKKKFKFTIKNTPATVNYNTLNKKAGPMETKKNKLLEKIEEHEAEEEITNPEDELFEDVLEEPPPVDKPNRR